MTESTPMTPPMLDATVSERVSNASNRMRGAADTAPTPSGSRSGPRWHVIATYAQAERRAVENLKRQGYETYLPLALVTRRDRVLRTMLHRVEVPLFPAYAFCQFDPDTTEWWPIRNTFGVYRLITDSAGRPIPLRAGVLEAVQAAEALAASSPREATQWAPGASVALATGPLAAHPAVVLSVHRDQARLAVLLFGALREVTAPLGWLVERQ